MTKTPPTISLDEIALAGAEEGSAPATRPDLSPAIHKPTPESKPEPRILEGLAEVIFPDRWQELVGYGHVWVARIEDFSRLFVSRLLILLIVLLLVVPFAFGFLPGKVQAVIDSPILAARAAWNSRDTGGGGGGGQFDNLVGPDGQPIHPAMIDRVLQQYGGAESVSPAQIEQLMRQYGIRRAAPASESMLPEIDVRTRDQVEQPKAETSGGSWFSGLFGGSKKKAEPINADLADQHERARAAEANRQRNEMLERIERGSREAAAAKAQRDAQAQVLAQQQAQEIAAQQIVETAPAAVAPVASVPAVPAVDLLAEQIKREEEAERQRIAAEAAAKKKREAAAAAAKKRAEDQRIREILAKQEAAARAKEAESARAQEAALKEQLAREEAERVAAEQAAAEEAKKKKGVGGFFRGLGSAVVDGVKQGAGVKPQQ